MSGTFDGRLSRLEDFAAARAREGEVVGKPCAPWLDPTRDFITEAQEESADRHNYLEWAGHQAQIAGTSTPEFREALMIAIQANRTSYVAAERARQILPESKR